MSAQDAHTGDAAAHDEAIAEQAAQWIVQLSASEAAVRAAAQRGFAAWQQADPRHAAMAERLQDFIGRVQRMRSDSPNTAPARAALAASLSVKNGVPDKSRKAGRSRAKRVIASLALALCFGVPTWLALQAYPLSYLTADLRSATGQWQSRVLADGSRITLNTASAVNLHFDAQRRVLELVQGEILVDVAKDSERPFIVETAHGSIRALGTRFVVSRDSEATVLSMLESRVQVRSASADDAVEVRAGQGLRLSAAGIGALEAIDARSIADAWKFHQLVVQEQSMPEVLDALARYRPGIISYDRAALASIKVTALLPLDDTGRALSLLANSFPGLRVRTLSPYLVRVDMPEAH